MIKYFKNHRENRIKYITILNVVEFNLSYFNKIPTILFSYTYDEFWLNIKNESKFINFNYNIYTREITFENDSISIDKNSMYYKKLQIHMKPLSARLADRDDHITFVNNKRKEYIDKFF